VVAAASREGVPALALFLLKGGGGIQNVPRIPVKTSKEARGKPVEGLAVRLPSGDFLVGFSITHMQSNETLAE